MNTITKDLKTGCNKTLHVTFNHVEYLHVKCGRGGQCESVAWEILNGAHRELGRKKFIELARGFHCEGGCAGAQTCFEAVINLISQEAK